MDISGVGVLFGCVDVSLLYSYLGECCVVVKGLVEFVKIPLYLE